MQLQPVIVRNCIKAKKPLFEHLLTTLLISALFFNWPASAAAEIQYSFKPTTENPSNNSTQKELIGIVFADRALNLVSEVEGQIATILAPLGHRVQQDEALAKLASPWIVHELDIAKADLASAKAKLKKANLERELAFDRRDRRLKLTDTWSVEEQTAVVIEAKMAEVDVILAQTQLDQQNAKINHLTARLDKTLIRAPFSGVISARFVEEGELVTKGQPLLRLITDTELGVRFGVPEKLIDRIREGVSLQAYFPLMGLSIKMSITHLAPEIDLSTGLATAEGILRIPKKLKGRILPGMTVRVRPGQ